MTKVNVNSKILEWARVSAGLSLEQAAKRLQIGKAFGKEPAARLDELERGVDQPSRPMLLKMSKVYRRSLVVFYLEAPPPKGNRGEDFRKLPDDYTSADEGLIDALVRDINARQDLVRSVLEAEEEASPLAFVASCSMNDGASAVRQKIANALKIDLKVFRQQRTLEQAFAYLRERVEQTGVFVLLIGDLGSHHSAIPIESFRGFALADRIAPFVVINDQDSRAAWSFTLLHEVAHIWLGKTGITDVFSESALEQFCNDIASHLLVREDELPEAGMSKQIEFEEAVKRVSAFAKNRNVSRSLVAYRLMRAGFLTSIMWGHLRAEFIRQWREHRTRVRTIARDKETGPMYYTIRRHRVGKALLALMDRMTSTGAITTSKAGKVLGVKGYNVYDLLRQAA